MATMSFSPLRRHHRAARAPKKATEREAVPVADLSGLALDIEHVLHTLENVRRNQWFESSLERLVLPFDNPDIDSIRQKVPDRSLGPRPPASGGDAARKESL